MNDISREDVEKLIAPVTIPEIEEVIKNSSPYNSPGPDRFDAHFFQVCWPIIGDDVSKAIKDFFQREKIPKQLKHTFITLIPTQLPLLISG